MSVDLVPVHLVPYYPLTKYWAFSPFAQGTGYRPVGSYRGEGDIARSYSMSSNYVTRHPKWGKEDLPPEGFRNIDGWSSSCVGGRI